VHPGVKYDDVPGFQPIVCGMARSNVAKRMECVQLAAAFEACQRPDTQGVSKAAASCTHSIRFRDIRYDGVPGYVTELTPKSTKQS